MPFKVIGIGDNVVDKYIHQNQMYPGGNALNFSAYARQLGIPSAYIGVFGSDFPAKYIQHTLDELGVEYGHSRFLEGENGYACIDLVNGERVFISSNRGGVSKTCALSLSQEELEYLKGFSLIHTSINSYIDTKFQDLKSQGVPISFDFSSKITPWYLAKVCPHIDFAIISCGKQSEDEILAMANRIHQMGTPYVIATRGAGGSLFSDGENHYTFTPTMVKAIDTLGAGDSFLTSFLTDFLQGEDQKDPQFILNCMEKASQFAAETCMVYGAFGFGTSLDFPI